ncbi:MAG TPA: PilN domain-containing protein, partial [Clostridiales bacterium]|nr:PilN domain-containing protein [Clostridiales bacterium]
EEEYKAIKAKHDEIKNELDLYDNIKSYKTKMTEIIKDFENLAPTSIVFDSIDYNDNIMVITGLSYNYTDIAQFMVKVRESEHVMATSFSQAELMFPARIGIEVDEYAFEIAIALFGWEDDEELVEVEEVPAELETGGEE